MTTSALTMAAMMLPGAVPTLLRRAGDGVDALAAPLFAAAYFGVWVVVGLALHALAQPGAAIGAMNVAWMSIVAALALAQKVVPPRAALDVLIALAIVALGVVIVLAPDSVPGVMPAAM
jgi:predicted metal-binding membrane protein